jgi:hypothetical protein
MGAKTLCVLAGEKISVNILRLIAPPLHAPPPRHKDLSEQNSEQTDKKNRLFFVRRFLQRVMVCCSTGSI